MAQWEGTFWVFFTRTWGKRFTPRSRSKERTRDRKRVKGTQTVSKRGHREGYEVAGPSGQFGNPMNQSVYVGTWQSVERSRNDNVGVRPKKAEDAQ